MFQAVAAQELPPWLRIAMNLALVSAQRREDVAAAEVAADRRIVAHFRAARGHGGIGLDLAHGRVQPLQVHRLHG